MVLVAQVEVAVVVHFVVGQPADGTTATATTRATGSPSKGGTTNSVRHPGRDWGGKHSCTSVKTLVITVTTTQLSSHEFNWLLIRAFLIGGAGILILVHAICMFDINVL